MQNKEMVVHPNHYQLSINIEVMDVIEIVTRKLKGVQAFYVGNVIKYILRAEKKNKLEDYKKALYYLNLTHDINYFGYKSLELIILNQVMDSIQNEQIKECFYRVKNREFSEAYEILENYIKEKENEQTTETEE